MHCNWEYYYVEDLLYLIVWEMPAALLHHTGYSLYSVSQILFGSPDSFLAVFFQNRPCYNTVLLVFLAI